ncbi:alpha/beta hydrolase [Corynebacterium glutamicum]|uniref:alpha/beta hydrolase n=1 Tax=Corynebacterium glutamicum TaxID=1718 RepID=UPI000744ACE8|nr:alpha/beta hydrolase [Corynebacterium glutamicum]ALZ99495.1 esterase [Corynebacterium glutamicum]
MSFDQPTTEFLKSLVENASGEPFWKLPATEARVATDGLYNLYGPGPELHSVSDQQVASQDGGQFPVRVFTPSENPNAVVVYYHGGGWVLENLQGYDTLGRQLAEKTGATVIVVEYRKSPEHQFPIPVQDAWAALKWAQENVAGDLPIIVAGDSAGANLATVVAAQARDAGSPAIQGQVLVCPPVDTDFDRDSYVAEENQTPIVNRDSMQWFWDQYVSNESDRSNPQATPLNSASLAGLPPALIVTAEHDVLRDEGEAYASALKEAGVEVEHRRFEGQMHTFFSMVNVLPGSAEAIDLAADRIKEFSSVNQPAN